MVSHVIRYLRTQCNTFIVFMNVRSWIRVPITSNIVLDKCRNSRSTISVYWSCKEHSIHDNKQQKHLMCVCQCVYIVHSTTTHKHTHHDIYVYNTYYNPVTIIVHSFSLNRQLRLSSSQQVRVNIEAILCYMCDICIYIHISVCFPLNMPRMWRSRLL